MVVLNGEFVQKISHIGSLLKKLYRIYTSECLQLLEGKGFSDLRPSFLEILIYICENEGASIKDIGKNCSLKKQTMTSHLNELEYRGLIYRKISIKDKREQKIYLTEYGEKFKFSLFESIGELERKIVHLIGDVELNRVEYQLQHFHEKIGPSELLL